MLLNAPVFMEQQHIIPATIGQEIVPPAEADQIEKLVAIFREIQEAKDRRQKPVPRNVHPKQHGCVRAEFVVEPALPIGFRQGIFREARTYAALVRFSNAKQRDDRLPDGHGMAIKLLEVESAGPGEWSMGSQDFVLVDHPVFFAKNAADMLSLAFEYRRLMLGGVVAKVRTLCKGLFSSDYRFKLLRQMGAKRPSSPLEVRYWSTTPMKFGEGAVKVSVEPQPGGVVLPPSRSPDKLRRALSAHLRERDACFDFLVQRQTDPAGMPIEDATVAWDESKSPWRKVATLRIPRQSFESPAQMKFGEDLSFTPWHALPEHRPLGGINRARRRIYDAMAAQRIESNGAVLREPSTEEVNAFCQTVN